MLFDDDVSFTGKGAFTDKNVGENKTVLLGEMSLSGAAAGNYELTQPDALATDIDRLASATWVGANSGNWFDPANWLNGAIPDLANVAQVHIPAGVTVYFDTTALGATGAAGVEAGVVQIDALLAANANLVQRNGALQLGEGGAILWDFIQQGGDFSNAGIMTLQGKEQQQALNDLVAQATNQIYRTSQSNPVAQPPSLGTWQGVAFNNQPSTLGNLNDTGLFVLPENTQQLSNEDLALAVLKINKTH